MLNDRKKEVLKKNWEVKWNRNEKYIPIKEVQVDNREKRYLKVWIILVCSIYKKSRFSRTCTVWNIKFIIMYFTMRNE